MVALMRQVIFPTAGVAIAGRTRGNGGGLSACVSKIDLDAAEGSDDPLRGKESDLGATAKAQNRLISIVKGDKGDTVSARPTEWSATVAGRKSYGKCPLTALLPSDPSGACVGSEFSDHARRIAADE